MSSTISSQVLFRSGVFLHHSTGGTIWGPNGSSTSIPQEITAYNTANGYIGSDAVSMSEVWFPGSGLGNEWYDWHRIFDNLDPNNNIYPYLSNNNIVVIKSCFPSSSISGYGTASDTSSNPSAKTVYNYKWHLRSIIRIMEQHPENFFTIWTNAPLVQEATNSSEALLAHQFTTWAKDTLAAGLDATYGAFPPNVYVFDFFHKLANSNHYMNPIYQIQSGDSHPNAVATELVAPQFVQEVFDTAIAYESGITLNCKVQLEGPYISSNLMTTILNTNNLIPLNSNEAYSTIVYNYTASVVGSIPNSNIVDWVLVELRTGTDSVTKVATRAAFLKNDGIIVDVDGSSPVTFTGLSDGNYYVVVRHRNHLAIMSASAIPLNGSFIFYDFSSAQMQAFGTNAMKDLGGGFFGMYAGDGNSDGLVTNTDFNVFNPKFTSAVSGYEYSDWNLDGLVTSTDFNFFNMNFITAKQSFVP
jgi:hypothetical protein